MLEAAMRRTGQSARSLSGAARGRDLVRPKSGEAYVSESHFDYCSIALYDGEPI